jgi:hypothetical protein
MYFFGDGTLNLRGRLHQRLKNRLHGDEGDLASPKAQPRGLPHDHL